MAIYNEQNKKKSLVGWAMCCVIGGALSGLLFVALFIRGPHWFFNLSAAAFGYGGGYLGFQIYRRSFRHTKVMTAALLALTATLASVPASAEKVVIGRYHTSKAAAAAYSATIQAITDNKFTLRLADKDQQTIQAYRTAFGDGAEFASVFITVKNDGQGSFIEATFTRHSGIFGGGSPTKWATDLGKELTKTIPDLTFETRKR